MVRIPVRNTIISPSLDFIKFQSSLMVIAAYAKAANQNDLYEQAKETHDNMARQYNAKTAPKKKGFWEQFKDNLIQVSQVPNLPVLTDKVQRND